MGRYHRESTSVCAQMISAMVVHRVTYLIDGVLEGNLDQHYIEEVGTLPDISMWLSWCMLFLCSQENRCTEADGNVNMYCGQQNEAPTSQRQCLHGSTCGLMHGNRCCQFPCP